MTDCTDQRACRPKGDVLPAQYDVIVHAKGTDTGQQMCFLCLCAAIKTMGKDIDATIRRIA